MKQQDFRINEILKIMNAMSENEYESIVNSLYEKLSKATNADDSVYNFISHNDNVIACKHCGGLHVVKNGCDRHGHQRYKCRDCNKWFSDTSLSVLSGTHKKAAVWKKYIKLMLDGKSIAKCAEECEISIQTAFTWRHKILAALSNTSFASGFNGMVEMDEMFVRISYKGNHKNSKNFIMPRKSFKRGTDNRSTENANNSKACILCVVDRNKSFSGVIPCKGLINLPILKKVFDFNQISTESIVMTDGFRAYGQYFREINIEHIVLPSSNSKKPTVKGPYHINNVNALHSRFRQFLSKYNGVSTKYLHHYLGMFLWLENHKKCDNLELVCNEIAASGTKLTAKDFECFMPEPELAPAA